MQKQAAGVGSSGGGGGGGGGKERGEKGPIVQIKLGSGGSSMSKTSKADSKEDGAGLGRKGRGGFKKGGFKSAFTTVVGDGDGKKNDDDKDKEEEQEDGETTAREHKVELASRKKQGDVDMLDHDVYNGDVVVNNGEQQQQQQEHSGDDTTDEEEEEEEREEDDYYDPRKPTGCMPGCGSSMISAAS